MFFKVTNEVYTNNFKTIIRIKSYKQIQLYLQPNVPRENWPDPKAQAGMVQIRFINKSEESFLIFDPQEWTNKLFNNARKNIISEVPK